MRHPPYRFERSRIVRQAWDDVPVYVRKLVAKEFVVDLLGVIDARERLGDGRDIFRQLNPLRRRQVEEFCRMVLQNDNGPAAKELIVMEIGFREPEIRNEMIGSWPGTCAGLARRIGHVRMLNGGVIISCSSPTSIFNGAAACSIAKSQGAREWRGARLGDPWAIALTPCFTRRYSA